MCTQLENGTEILPRIGFSIPDGVDKEWIKFFLENVRGGQKQHCQINKNLFAENRFIAKLAIGILNCLFNKTLFSNKYMNELYKGLWYKFGDETPKICGVSAFSEENNFKTILGVPYGVTISIFKQDNLLFMNLNIGMKLNYFIQCGEITQLNSQEAKLFKQGGLCIVIYKSLSRFVELGFYEFIAHKSGDYINNELLEIERMIHDNEYYFQNL